MKKLLVAVFAAFLSMSVAGVYAGEATKDAKKSETGMAKSEKGMEKKADAMTKADEKKKKKDK